MAGGVQTLEQLPFFSGYGVETGLLIDVFERCGLEAIAQVDLLERIHHNQPLEALSKMSFAILQTVVPQIGAAVRASHARRREPLHEVDPLRRRQLLSGCRRDRRTRSAADAQRR